MKSLLFLVPGRTLSPRIRPRLLLSLTAIALGGCAINPRPSFEQTRADIQSRTGLDTAWMRTEADEAATLVRVRELLKNPLSPRLAAQIAVINNRELQGRLEELGIAQAGLAAASLPGNPEIEGFLGWPNESGGAKKIDLGFGLDVLDLFVLPSRKRLARLELKQAKAIAGDEILRTATAAQIQTYDLQALEARSRGTRMAMEIEQALTDFAEARLKAGNLSDLEYEQERSHLDELEARLKGLELDVRRKRESINALLGLSGELTQWTVAESDRDLPSEVQDIANLERIAVEQRFDLAALRSAVEMLEGSWKLQKKTRLLPAGIHVGARTEKEGGTRVAGPSLRLQLPIFNPGRAESARLEALTYQARRMLEDREIHARTEVRQKQDQIVTAQQLVRHYKHVVAPRKKRIVDMKKDYYNMMLTGADELLRARRDEIEAEAPLIEAQHAYWVARTELAHALGGALPTSNTRPVEGEGK